MYTLTIKSIVLEDKGEYICERSGKRDLMAQKLKLRYRLRKKSSEKFFLSPIFVFCSLSDPYSTSMPNFKCQNNLKDPKRAVERQATFYSLLFSIGMGGVSKKQLKKTA